MDVRNQIDRIERIQALDALEAPLQRAAGSLLRSRKLTDTLQGAWFGHPVHPALSDVPVGCYVMASVFDLTGRRGRRAADVLLTIGLAASVPTAASGLADWKDLDPPVRRTATVHAVGNAVATTYYLRSLWARLRGRRARGVRLALMGTAVAGAAAYLGGHLVFRRGVGVSRVAFDHAPSGDWTVVGEVSGLQEGRPSVFECEGKPVMVVKTGERVCAIADTCSHAGGPLHEGTVDHAGVVTCPWHGSAFAVADGRVVHGPASAPQPAFDVRVTDGKLELRARR